MELVLRKADLLRELQLLQGIVERKITIPVLGNVLIEAEGAEIRMVATDLEVGLRSRCEASVAKPGVVTIPAKKLFEIVKNLPESDKSKMDLGSGSSKAKAWKDIWGAGQGVGQVKRSYPATESESSRDRSYRLPGRRKNNAAESHPDRRTRTTRRRDCQ